NKVIVPPTVVNHALNNPNFSILVTALTRSDLSVDYVSTLSGDGPFTVFAPTNDAFADLLTELGANSLDDIPAATLDAVLQYHVVAGANVLASQLSDEQVVTTFQGGTFKVDLSSGAQIIDAQNRTANIILTDVQGTNGVVHAIDKVILP
ncbi:MAG: fasciclin domain-containing protein, partial [Saprospiraceae bacterium]|nr:fasciclin domain-containing protein [Saprospiraceae bacterium]